MDTTKLATYSDAYLQELRANAVKRVDAARFAVARGAIGGTRMKAMKEIDAGRAERDAIDVELKKREPEGEVAHFVAVTPAEAERMFEPVEVPPAEIERNFAAELEPDLDLLIDEDPPAVPKRGPRGKKG